MENWYSLRCKVLRKKMSYSLSRTWKTSDGISGGFPIPCSLLKENLPPILKMTYRVVTLLQSAWEIIVFACPLKAAFVSWKVFLDRRLSLKSYTSRQIHSRQFTKIKLCVPMFQRKNFITVSRLYVTFEDKPISFSFRMISHTKPCFSYAQPSGKYISDSQ